MKKSTIAAAVIATAFAATANAGYFQIAGASYNPGSTPLVPGSFNMEGSSTDFSASTTGTGANTIAALNAADVTALDGISVAADTITYFSYVDSGGLGHFGIVINSTVTRTLTISMTYNAGDGASGGTKGVLTNASISGEFINSGSFIDTNQSVSAGKTYYVFGGLTHGSAFNGSVSNGQSESGSFGIAYLSWNGSGWTTMASLASGASGSAISVASYVVPVPAPALLAGAGLVGAAALRRRMAKKA
jgi:hypothetical protein